MNTYTTIRLPRGFRKTSSAMHGSCDTNLTEAATPSEAAVHACRYLAHDELPATVLVTDGHFTSAYTVSQVRQPQLTAREA